MWIVKAYHSNFRAKHARAIRFGLSTWIFATEFSKSLNDETCHIKPDILLCCTHCWFNDMNNGSKYTCCDLVTECKCDLASKQIKFEREKKPREQVMRIEGYAWLNVYWTGLLMLKNITYASCLDDIHIIEPLITKTT